MRVFKIHSLVLIFLCFATFTFGQPPEIKIKFIGNCGMVMTDGEANVYVDFPYKSGAHKYAEYDPAEMDSIPENAIFIFTHKHSDHYSRKLVKQVKKNHEVYGPWNSDELENLTDINDFSVEAFVTKHQFSFHHRSYLITWHGERLYFSGDTESADTMATVKNIDWGFVPAWLLMDANERDLKLDIENVAVYHIGPLDNVTTENPKITLLKTEGQQIEIPY